MPLPTPGRPRQCRLNLENLAVCPFFRAPTKTGSHEYEKKLFKISRRKVNTGHPEVEVAGHLQRQQPQFAPSTQKESIRQQTPQLFASQLRLENELREV